jgi:glycosyltransferase involved in cell wall biosynthesis
VNSGANIDDSLAVTGLEQISVSRILVRSSIEGGIPTCALHTLSELKSPYPRNIFFRQLSKIRFQSFVAEQIKGFKPDVLFFHFGQTAASLLNSLEKFQIPFIVAFYGHDISVALRQPRWIKKYAIFAKTNGRFLVLSADVKNRVAKLGIDPSRISVYNYPLDLNPYFAVQKDPPNSIYTITIPGRLVEKKGHIVLFKAVAHLKTLGTLVNLRVLGYGNLWPSFQEIASQLSIDSQIAWIDSSESTIKGHFNSLYASVLASTDLVVLPCITSSDGDDEAGPALVLCLAQASGTPVLTTPFEGHEISITDGETGFLSKESDPVNLAEKILFCIANPILVKKVAQAGRQHVQGVFDKERNLGIILNVIGEQANLKNLK